MRTIFFSGSRSISRLNPQIRERINNILSNNFDIVIGDANGADKAIQKFLQEQDYANVHIYFSGKIYRNNVGNWQFVQVDSKGTGRVFYTAKDKKMAEIADYGFILWDGKSIGSLNNIAELLQLNKPSLVYHSQTKEFFKIKSSADLENIYLT
ncbi:hypothetical protein [Neisseria meningitidis]|uniref:hypothetical protein n=1 Tax=Neisseria meningitidis TaxID=487 RepID=UPI001E62B012|nr:hypothetical protein [Neisseria meningitidis]